MANGFDQIKAWKGSQNTAFEELVCQIFRRTEAVGSDTWRRLDGAGGDGGVEAFWYAKPKKKTGIQAKWFLRSAEIKWEQIKKSFKTALEMHADLAEYKVCIACDLTGRTGRKGQSGSEAWDSCRIELAKLAQAAKRDVAIKLISASDLHSLLALPSCVGLAEYWLGGLEITEQRLREWLNTALLELGERYHPGEHVQVVAEGVFRGLARDPSLVSDAIVAAVEASESYPLPTYRGATKELSDLIVGADEKVVSLGELERAFHVPLDEPLPRDFWLDRAREARIACQEVALATHDLEAKELPSESKQSINYLRHSAYRKSEHPSKLEQLLRERRYRAESARSAVLLGPAGIGKSHLLAASAQAEIDAGGVAILFLGHWFQSNRIWEEIAFRLNWSGTDKATLLGALDTAAAARGRRAVIAIDAINEGEHAGWRRQLASVVNDVLKYKNLAIIISCRDVYSPHLIDPSVYDQSSTFELTGFTTEDEQEQAARQFLDSRGITRPPSPWLAPEFSNPLFLRSAAVALERLGRKEFPHGLTGAKAVFGFFVDAISSALGTQYDASGETASCVPRALRALARELARQRVDSLDVPAAALLVEREFGGRSNPAGWLDVLCRNSLLTKFPTFDPDADPFQGPEHHVQFAYQRLQDHLMAEALLEGALDPTALFGSSGRLNFLFDKYGQLEWRWSGLVEALSIQVPERLAVELIDEVNKHQNQEFAEPTFELAFLQSIKWRSPSTITDRSRQLVTVIAPEHGGVFTLLIELVVRADHPLNADRLHSILKAMNLVERDATWTREISSEEQGGNCSRLIRWCSDTDKRRVDPEVLRLATVSVAWLLTSTSRIIRDGATKALASLFVDDASLFAYLMQKLDGVDDPYVLERLLASAYGYLLRMGSCDRRSEFATIVASAVFGRGTPIANIYVRDYARCIVELAVRDGAYAGPTPIDLCRPPYGSPKPVFNVSEKQIEAIAKRAGGSAIAWSCGEHGDFKRYELEYPVGRVSKVPHSMSPPVTARQRAEEFEATVASIVGLPSLLEELTKLRSHFFMSRFLIERSIAESRQLAPYRRNDYLKDQRRLVAQIRSLLTPELFLRFQSEWMPTLADTHHTKEIPRFDFLAAGRWVARRAYGYGWTEKRFPNDKDWSDRLSRERPRVERIGKKYQWLARAELLARLADNYWLHGGYSDSYASRYDNPLDLGYERDVDPTLFSHSSFRQHEIPSGLVSAPLAIVSKDGDERFDWPFQASEARQTLREATIVDRDGNSWTRLAWYSGQDRRRQGERLSVHGFQQQVFWFLRSIFINPKDATAICAAYKKAGHIEIDRLNPVEHVDHPFVFEEGQSTRWPEIQDRTHSTKSFEGHSFQAYRPVEEYGWEHHLDSTLPNGMRFQTIASWWMARRELRRDPLDVFRICDRSGDVTALYLEVGEQNCGFIVRTDELRAVLRELDLEILTIVVGERNAWADDGDFRGTYRRFNGLMTGIANFKSIKTWNEDNDPRTGS